MASSARSDDESMPGHEAGLPATVVDAPPGAHCEDEDRCPSCDAAGAWRVSRRHRYSPFGTVTLLLLAFWSAVLSWLLGFGYVPAVALSVVGILLALATRRAEVCEACGYVRPR